MLAREMGGVGWERAQRRMKEHTLTRLKAVFISGIKANHPYEAVGLTPPMLMRIIAMNVKLVGMRVSQATNWYLAELGTILLLRVLRGVSY
jgi:hypothetical protein